MKKNLLFFILISLITSQLFAQVQISGIVTDESGKPLPGANVLIKGTTQGVITDLNGNYTISNVPEKAFLVISFIGMESQEISTEGKTLINVTLHEEAYSLDDVVVVGYGTVKRANLTGSVADMKAEEIEDIPAANLSTALEGRLVGVRVELPTGKPGADTKFRVRTESNYSDRGLERALFIIDGVACEQSDFDLLDPSEVKSISILKDAAAAVYGTRAVGGVVLVETKRGQEGKAKITYNGSYGIAQATSFPEMMNSRELAEMWNEILGYDNNDTTTRKKPDHFYFSNDELEYFDKTNYNWLDAVWHNGYQVKHSINVSGGTKKISYFAGGSYYNETGNIDNLYAQKYSIRTNLDAKITNDLIASLGLSFYQGNKKQPNFATEESEDVLRDTYKQALTGLPWVPPVIDGYPVNNMVRDNPYGLIQSGSYKSSKSNTMNLLASFNYTVPFVEGLKLNMQYSRQEKFQRGKDYTQDYMLYEFPAAGTNRHIVIDTLPPQNANVYSNTEGLTEKVEEDHNYQLNASANYNKLIGSHDIAAMIVYEQRESGDEVYWTRVRAGADVQGYEYLWAFKQANMENGSNAHEGGRKGFVGRINYAYAQKYLLEATFRYEASDKFSPDHRWGFFPAISGGWVVSEEGFLKDNSIISFLKFRGSIGRVGNDNLGMDQWRQLFIPTDNGAVFGGIETNGITGKTYGLFTPTLTWQKSNSYNVGMDMRMMDGHIVLGTDYFYRFTYDILERRNSQVPAELGVTSSTFRLPQENHGEMEVRGIEIELGYNNKIGTDFRYYVKGLFSWDKRKILKKFQNPTVIGSWRDELLITPDNKQGLICLGVLNTQEEIDALLAEHPNYCIVENDRVIEPQLGMLYYQDLRGVEYIDTNTGRIAYTPPNDTIDLKDDRTIIADHTDPPYRYGFSLGASWKGIKVDMVFSGAFGHKVFVEKDEQVVIDPEVGVKNVFAFWNDRWTPENTDAEYPRPYLYGFDEQHSTFWMRDGHTLRMNTINISYTFPKKITNRIKIPSLRVYFSGRNLWTIISPFDFKDPGVSRAYDYPIIKMYNFGLNFTL